MKRAGIPSAAVELQPSAASHNCRLVYEGPAGSPLEALPIGNGRIGALVFGGVAEERLQINEESLWSGSRQEWNLPKERAVLSQVRSAILQGQYSHADQLAHELQGPNPEVYLPLADVVLHFAEHPGLDATSEPLSDYLRELDLEQGVARTDYWRRARARRGAHLFQKAVS